MLNVFNINNFFEEHEFKESNFIWNTDRYLKVLIGNTVDRRSLGVPICPFYPYGDFSKNPWGLNMGPISVKKILGGTRIIFWRRKIFLDMGKDFRTRVTRPRKKVSPPRG